MKQVTQKTLDDAWEKYWYEYLNCHKTQLELSAPSKAHFFNAYRLGAKAMQERAQVLVYVLEDIESQYNGQAGTWAREALQKYKESVGE